MKTRLATLLALVSLGTAMTLTGCGGTSTSNSPTPVPILPLLVSGKFDADALDPEALAAVEVSASVSSVSDSNSATVEANFDGRATRDQQDPKTFVLNQATRREWQATDELGRVITFSCGSCQNGLGETAFALAYREPSKSRVTRILKNLNLTRTEFLRYADDLDSRNIPVSRSRWTKWRDKFTDAVGNVVITVVNKAGEALGAAAAGYVQTELGPTTPAAPQNNSASSGPATVGLAGNAAKTDPKQVDVALKALNQVSGVHNQFYTFVETLSKSPKATSAILRVLKAMEYRPQ